MLHIISLLLLATITRGFPSSETCISTPFAYKELFEEIQWNIGVPPQCVSQNLFTTIQGPYDCPVNDNPLPPTVSKYETSTWGWASPSINLEVYLDIASRHTGDPYGTVAEMCKYVGLTDKQINSNCSYTLAVFEKQKAKEHGLFAPTWAAWFPRLSDYFHLTFTWEVQKELVLGGFEDFDHLTGCHNRTVAPNALCSSDFIESWNLCKVAIYGGTEACAKEFGDKYGGGLGASAAHTRAFLLACMGANPLFTGVGYGWNGVDFTGPEFLVDNVNLEEELGAVRFLVYSPSSANTHKLPKIDVL